MKQCIILLLTAFLCNSITAQTNTYQVFSYAVPDNFVLKENNAEKLLYELVENNTTYCQLYLLNAIKANRSAEQNFLNDWNKYAAQTFNIQRPEEKSVQQKNRWKVITGRAKGRYETIVFTMQVSTYTSGDTSYAIVAVYNDAKYTGAVNRFEQSVQVLGRNARINQPPTEPARQGGKMKISKYITNFDDGWVGTPLDDYVQLKRNGTEIRLYYVNDQWDKNRPNTTEPNDYYWAKVVTPLFSVSNVQPWVGVQYPVIYFVAADAVDRQTGKACYVTMKIVYEGGARVIVTVAPNRTTYEQQFAHPNDLNRMLGYNKFGVAAQDVTGVWTGGGGGGVEYYNVYSGTYAGMSAISTSDEFTFNSNGTYESWHSSANTNNGGTRFAKLEYKGRFTVSDWELTASNRVSGKTKKFWARLEAIRGGYLLVLTDSDYEPLKYVLFKKR
jgi:hypothetical protein